MHTLKSGYCFLCMVRVLYVLFLLNFGLSYIWILATVAFQFLYPGRKFAGLKILSASCWCIEFVTRRAVFNLECLEKLFIFRISELWYENITQFLSCCLAVFGSFCFCFLAISFKFKLWMIWNYNPLFWAIASIIFHSCCLACFVIGSVNILFM